MDSEFRSEEAEVRNPQLKAWAVRLAILALFVSGAVYLVSADGPAFTARELAFYADANLNAFVRPGLAFKVNSVNVTSDGTVKVDFSVTDPKGSPLDRTGVYTPGVVSTSFILARIPKGQTQYVAYTTRSQTSPITGMTATQAGTDSGGTYSNVADGEYLYTFKTKLPSGYDATATHTVGLYGNRNLTDFNLGTNLADTTFDFVPNGAKVTVTRDVIKTVSCNKCHQDLSAHGTTGRKDVQLCILCHQPQSVDPDTGNTVDIKVMIHKIHAGSSLPSVLAGTPYVIIGNAQSVNDFSTVVFPADTRRCTFCHEQTTGAAQAKAYLKPNLEACNSCHDNVNFSTGANHGGVVQTSSDHCAECHQPQGETEFDKSIVGAHTIPTESVALPGTVFKLLSVTGTAGQPPTVSFSVNDKSGAPIPVAQMNSLNLVLAGPNTDYPSSISESATKATTAGNGTYSYTFKGTIPAGATGSFTMGIEGYRNITIYPGTDAQQAVRDAGVNQTLAFSVDGSPVAPRRTVAATADCNQCHAFLSLHGGLRNQVQQCVLCHNPNATDSSQRPAAQLPAQGIDFRMMIHRIHTGENLGAPFVIYGYGGSVNDFSDVRFPGDRRNCTACHVNGSQELPLAAGHLNVQDPRGLLNPVGPTTAACTSCHTEIFAASHALANTNALGESCAACHSPEDQFSVDQVHAH